MAEPLTDTVIQSLDIPCSHTRGAYKCDGVAGNIDFWRSGKITTRWTVKHGYKHPSDTDFPIVFRVLAAQRPEVLVELVLESCPAFVDALRFRRPELFERRVA